MKAFFFVNQYLAGVHCGIQAGHCIDQMWSEYSAILYDPNSTNLQALATLKEFSVNHRTFVLLNGGDHEALNSMYRFMCSSYNKYPFMRVAEPGLNYALTCVGIILPERLYDDKAQRCGQILAAGDVTKKDGTVIPAATMADPDNFYTEWEREFLARKSRCRLAQ